MNTATPIIDNDWLDFLREWKSEGFLSRIWQTSEEYEALLLAILPGKSQPDLDLDRDQFLQLQEGVKRENRQKEVLEFAQWHIYGCYEQIFLYRLHNDTYSTEWVQDCWNTIWEALSRLSDEEQETAVTHCKNMCLSLETDYPDADFYKWAKSFFKDFDFRSGIPSMPSRYVPGEPLIQNKIVRWWTDVWIEWVIC